MKASDTLTSKMKEFEGCKLYAYRDAGGTLTIGYGHVKGVKAGMAITQKQADEFLRQDLAPCESYVDSLGLELTQGQFDALVDFCFNLGAGSLGRSTLLKRIRGNATDLLIIREFMLWTHCGGKVLKGLVKRRKWEAETFTGCAIYQSDTDLKWHIRKSSS